MSPAIEFFEGISEELSDVRLRRSKASGVRNVLMVFEKLNALDRFNSFTQRFAKGLRLRDEEGEITIQPDSVQFIYSGAEGDDLERVECKFDILREDHWERFMRFMERYAEANGMVYGDTPSKNG